MLFPTELSNNFWQNNRLCIAFVPFLASETEFDHKSIALQRLVQKHVEIPQSAAV